MSDGVDINIPDESGHDLRAEADVRCRPWAAGLVRRNHLNMETTTLKRQGDGQDDSGFGKR